VLFLQLRKRGRLLLSGIPSAQHKVVIMRTGHKERADFRLVLLFRLPRMCGEENVAGHQVVGL
jgi:hypothetical protein